MWPGARIERHKGAVSRVLHYRMVTDKADRGLLIHLTADGKVTDFDIVEDSKEAIGDPAGDHVDDTNQPQSPEAAVPVARRCSHRNTIDPVREAQELKDPNRIRGFRRPLDVPAVEVKMRGPHGAGIDA